MTNETMHEVRNYSTRETAAEMRKALKRRWPNVKFSVRMDRGTAYGWIGVAWTDGPTEAAVRAVCGGFKSQRFDSMDDSYRQVEPTMYAREDGTTFEPRWSCCGVTTHRHYSDDTQAQARAVVVPGSRWWRDDEAPQMFDPLYFGTRELLKGLDLTYGWPSDVRQAWREPWQR